MLIIYFS